MNSKKYKIIEFEGRKLRCYNELLVSPIGAFYSELEVYLNSGLEDGYNIYIVYNQPSHNIILNDDDIKGLQTADELHKTEDDIPNNIKFLKKNQCRDFKLVCLVKDIDFLFLIPLKDENNRYYYNFMIVTKNESIIFDIINFDFKLITFKSLQKLIASDINEGFLKNLFQIYDVNEKSDGITTIFKNSLFTSQESSHGTFVDGCDFPKDYYIERLLSLICVHFYFDSIFNPENSLGDLMNFCTNFLELTSGVVVDPSLNDTGFKPVPFMVGFVDLISDNHEILPISGGSIKQFNWTPDDFENDYIRFLEGSSKWFEPDKKTLEERKARRNKKYFL